ncbi:superoxide dismutase family protein [Moraxella boevrei]|uniref:superoxide dismutase family protein n=1 Tax=Faucicola boevrei TaxID=346665 RepID=UPI003736A19E
MSFYNTTINGVQVRGEITGLIPHHTYAIHIHEKGLCSDNGKDSGGHFNPHDAKHGHPDATDSHAGDMPNITADANGVAVLNFANQKISTNQTATDSVQKRAVVIHANADDYVSQPAGNAGDRVICGVIN